MRGHLLTTIPINSGGGLNCPGGAGCPVWDATVNGQVVTTGVYIYVINVESIVISGALVVLR